MLRVRRLAALAVAAALLGLSGCNVDTQIVTEIAENGTVKRVIAFELKGVERAKEQEAYPAKSYEVPKDTPWKVLVDTQTRFEAVAETASGEPVPGGYARRIKVLERVAKNTVKLKQRDHFLARSFEFHETFTDTVDPKEFKPTLMAEYDRFADGILKGVRDEFGETHDIDSADRYVRKELRELVDETAARVMTSGLVTALTSATFRLYIGGFPLRNFDALTKTAPRDVLLMVIQHCLKKIQLKPEKKLEVDEALYEKQLKALMGGNVDQQAAAHRKLLAMGPAVQRRIAEALRKARKKDPKSGVTVRLTALDTALKDAGAKRMEALVKKLSREMEDRYLNPPAEAKAETEATVAKLVGAHIEGNFAPVTFSFLCRLKMPGELMDVDRAGHKLADGYVRWNFDAMSFYHKPLTCRARSVVWNDANVKALSQALTGESGTINLRKREDMETAISVLGDEDLARLTESFRKSVEAKGRAPYDALGSAGDASKALKDCLAKLSAILADK